MTIAVALILVIKSVTKFVMGPLKLFSQWDNVDDDEGIMEDGACFESSIVTLTVCKKNGADVGIGNEPLELNLQIK